MADSDSGRVSASADDNAGRASWRDHLKIHPAAELFNVEIPWDELTDLRLERDTWKRMAQRLETENKDLMMRLVVKENQCRWCHALKERDGLAAELERMKKGALLRDAAPAGGQL